jgi:hypothetical protein
MVRAALCNVGTTTQTNASVDRPCVAVQTQVTNASSVGS